MSVLYKIFKVSSGTNDLHNRNAPIPFDTFLEIALLEQCLYRQCRFPVYVVAGNNQYILVCSGLHCDRF